MATVTASSLAPFQTVAFVLIMKRVLETNLQKGVQPPGKTVFCKHISILPARAHSRSSGHEGLCAGCTVCWGLLGSGRSCKGPTRGHGQLSLGRGGKGWTWPLKGQGAGGSGQEGWV